MKKLTIVLITILILAGMCVPVSAASNVAFAGGSFLWEKNGYIYGIPKETTCDIVASNFKGEDVIKDKDGNSLAGSALVGTGAKVTAGKEAEIVIVGDINGDGKLTSVDYLRIKQYTAGQNTIDGAAFVAADINGDGSIKSVDYLSIKQCFSGKKDLYTGMKAEPYKSDITYKTYDTSKQKMPRNEITIGVFRYDGELWDDAHMAEFKNDFGGEYLMSYSSHDTGRKAKTLYQLCDKYGVGIMGRSLPRYVYPNEGKANPVIDDPNYENFDAKLSTYSYNYDCVWGDDVYDEPRAEQFDWIAGAIERYRTKFPEPSDRFFYVNLNPMNWQQGNIEGFGAASYADYIKQYVTKVDTDYISFDIYPFDNNFHGMNQYYLLNLDTVATAAKESGKDFWIILQAGENPPVGYDPHLQLNESQLKYQVYTSLAYGAKSIAYACYSPCWWEDGTSLVTQAGEKTDLWYSAQKINKDLKFLSPTFMQYNYVDTFAEAKLTTVTQLRLQNKRSRARGFEGSRGFSDFSTETGVLIGAFEEKNGDGYAVMLTDTSDPYDTKIVNEVTFKTRIEGTVTCIQSGTETVLTPDANGVYTVTLGSGEGAFVTVK